MARKQIIEWVDDLTGETISDGSGNPTTEFGLDGVTYEVDLTEANREILEKALEPFIQAGRRQPRKVVTSRIQAPPRGPAKVDPAQKRAIRTWWSENWQQAQLPKPTQKGRIPEKVLQAYEEHGGRRIHPQVPMPFAS